MTDLRTDALHLRSLASATEFLAVWQTMHLDHDGPVYQVEFRRTGDAR